MTDIVTVAGTVATPIKHTVTAEGLEISSFRLASNHRRYDKTKAAWVDGETNWFSVVAFRQLAVNVDASLAKGQRVLVTGRLRVRDWTDGERSGRDVEIVADALGPDLSWGTASYTRTPRVGTAPETAPAPAEQEAFPAEAQVEAALPF